MAKFELKKFYEWPLATRLLLGGLVCAATIYVGYRWDLSGLYSKLGGLQQQEKDVKDQLALMIKKQIGLTKEVAQFPAVVAELIKWRNQFSTDDKTSDILNEILKLGAANQLFFNVFTPSAEYAENGFMKIPVKVIVVGGYHQLANFFSQIANMPYIIVIDDFSLSNENPTDVLGPELANKANTENLLTASFILDLYHKPGPQ